jgi:hypothetical protein
MTHIEPKRVVVARSQTEATRNTIKKIAYYTAREATGARREAAVEHCRKLGVDHTAPTFAEAVKQT